MSMEELSQTRKLAVARELQGMVGKLLERSDFQSFDSSDAVLEYVSRTPEAVGLIPWDKVGPRMKAIAVNGKPLLELGTAGLESYPLQRASSSDPDTQRLRRIVAAGDVVMDRGVESVEAVRRLKNALEQRSKDELSALPATKKLNRERCTAHASKYVPLRRTLVDPGCFAR
jgi:hypothetical protein